MSVNPVHFEIPSKRLVLPVEGRKYRDYQILAESIILPKDTPRSKRDQVILNTALQLLSEKVAEIIAQRPDCPFVHIDELLGKAPVAAGGEGEGGSAARAATE